MSRGALLAAVLLVAVACSSNDGSSDSSETSRVTAVFVDADSLENPVLAEPLLEGVVFDRDPLSARNGASVVWTGREMIVSGGFVPSPSNDFSDTDFLFDGAAFDPASGVWRSISPRPGGSMTWPASFWTGDALLVVGAGGAFSYAAEEDEWEALPEVPFALPDLVRDNEWFEAAWSGDTLYVWVPSTDEMAAYQPGTDRWDVMPGPELDSYPAKLLADENRLVALGTGWPSSGVPLSSDVSVSEWVDGAWQPLEPVSVGDGNIADVDAAVIVDGEVVVWGDLSNRPSPTFLLDIAGLWKEAPPMPIHAGMGHPGSVVIEGQVLALSDRPEVAVFNPGEGEWSTLALPAELSTDEGWPGPLARDVVWTGTEVLVWTGHAAWRWTPFHCPVTIPPGDAFVPPEPWSETPNSGDLVWFGTDDLWTVLDVGAHQPRKSVWWSTNFQGGADEEAPELEVIFQRLDVPAEPVVFAAPGTNAFTPADRDFMINGLQPDEPGCWQATATYKGATLSYVYES